MGRWTGLDRFGAKETREIEGREERSKNEGRKETERKEKE